MREIRLINRGGFGVVHEVEAHRLRLAKKTFDPLTSDPEEREKLRKRFVREVRVQSQIRHPNVMPVVKFDLDASRPWFTMPLASESFEQKIGRDRDEGSVDAEAWQDILAAVEELHRLGYVHRDLKPANVLMVDEKWVLADFGLILPMARDTTILTSSKSAYGSHYYAAPEQARDFRNTPEQADIFALGCILRAAHPWRWSDTTGDAGYPSRRFVPLECTALSWRNALRASREKDSPRLQLCAQRFSTSGGRPNSMLLSRARPIFLMLF